LTYSRFGVFFIKALYDAYFSLCFIYTPNSTFVIRFLATKTFSTYKISRGQQYTISLLLIMVVAGSSFLLSGLIGYKVVAYLLLVTLSVIALFCDIVPVILSAVVSALVWNFFFIPPRYTFHISTTEDVFLFTMYFVIAVLHAILMYKIKQLQKLALEREEKNNTLKLYNTLLNSLSHELKTPIATIIGASDNLLTANGKLTAENKQSLLLDISVASLRLNQQVQNLLNISRLESGTIQLKKDWCDINELIYKTIDRLGEYSKHHVLNIELLDNLPLFKLDEGLMEQVLYNLIFNAITYTPEASIITIKAECKEHKYCIITIEDDGQGFPESEITKVFDKFYRLDHSKTGGTGLGLSIAKGFVEAHGGTILLENAALGGARFIITIPTEVSYANELKNE
jgi:two-component system sensor histidine kinase KdpD